MYAYLRRFGGKVAESLILPSSSSSVLLSFPCFWPWPDGNMTSAVRGVAMVLDSFFMGFFASRPSNAPVLWGFVHQGSRMYAYLRRDGGNVTESLILPSSSFPEYVGTTLGSARQMALRKRLEAHFEHFWAQLAKWLSGGVWRLILSISGVSSPNGSQEASGSSF